MAKQTPKSWISNDLTTRIKELGEHCKTQSEAVANDKPSRWYRPDGPQVSLFDLAYLGSPYSRADVNNMFDAAMTPAAPGTSADLGLAQLQGDLLAAMERAYRTRHRSGCRDRIQPGARLAGHSHAQGLLAGGWLGYLQSMDASNKGETV